MTRKQALSCFASTIAMMVNWPPGLTLNRPCACCSPCASNFRDYALCVLFNNTNDETTAAAAAVAAVVMVPTINSNSNNQRSDIPVSHRWSAQQPIPLLAECQPRMTVALLFLHRLGIEQYRQIPAERQRWALTDSLLQ